MKNEKTDQLVFIIFGATGDLTKRKLLPAVYALALDHLLPAKFRIIALGRREMTSTAFQDQMEEAVKKYSRRTFSQDIWEPLKKRITYLTLDFAGEPEEYHILQEALECCSAEGLHHHLFFLAVSPELFAPITVSLHKNRLLAEDKGWRRVMIEKPFGFKFCGCI